MAYDKIIQIQKLNQETDEWELLLLPSGKAERHAEVNRVRSKEFSEAGAERSEQTMGFRLRYAKSLRPIRLNTQLYRILYEGALYDITSYDDYKEQHQTVVLEGGSYARDD